MKRSNEQVTVGIVLALVLLLAPAAFAQKTPPSPAAQPHLDQSGLSSNKVDAASGTSRSTLQASVPARPSYLTPISGLQGVLAETLEGAPVAEQSVDEKFNPASSVKLATALVAIQTLGPNHRFITSLWTGGKLDPVTGTLNGDLVIAGCDPSFHYEHAVMLARDLNNLGIRTVAGNLIVAPSFTMNFEWSATHSGELLLETLDSARRSAAATRAWLDERSMIGDRESLSSVPSVMVRGTVQIGSAPQGAMPLLTHNSSRLVDVLKVLLCYSNNFMAERLGGTLGGPQTVSSTLVEKLKISPDELVLSSTSGLGVNRVTPRAMMKILRGLDEELSRHQLSLADILPVAGVDPGTLEDRYTDISSRGSVIAKTGTLVRTDGGASALVGETKTKSGRIVFFVIFNEHGSVIRFRQNQDEIVAAIQNTLGGPAPFDYRPVRLTMRLADHDSESAKSRGEYEPKDQ